MILNKPFWSIIDPAGKEVVWDYESPEISTSRSALQETLKGRLLHAKRYGSTCGHDLAWWQNVTIKKVTVHLT
jgi:hypothetical protein